MADMILLTGETIPLIFLYSHCPSKLPSSEAPLYRTPGRILTLIFTSPFWISIITGKSSKSTRSAGSSLKSNAHKSLVTTSRNSTHASGRPKQLWNPTLKGLLADNRSWSCSTGRSPAGSQRSGTNVSGLWNSLLERLTVKVRTASLVLVMCQLLGEVYCS